VRERVVREVAEPRGVHARGATTCAVTHGGARGASRYAITVHCRCVNSNGRPSALTEERECGRSLPGKAGYFRVPESFRRRVDRARLPRRAARRDTNGPRSCA